MKNWIGISLGDVTGIGPEVALKAIAAEAQNDATKYLLIGDENNARQLNSSLGLDLPLGKFSSHGAAGKFFITNPLTEPLLENLPAGSPPAANAAVLSLRDGGQRCLCGELDALVTAPVNKESIIRAGHKFIGQTEFLSELAQAKRTAMMLLGTDERGRWLRVALATVHISIKSVPEKLTAEKITLAIELATQSCRDLGLSRAKIAVAGLNPHAGEGGEFGDEEIKIISPTVLAAQKKGFDVVGPLSGDTVFHYALQGDFDAVVAMYHDQGLAPLKAVAFDSGVNWTLGLPFIRTSPDHGTAYDIAGKGIANPSSMIAAIRLAKQLAANNK
ncbi:MAG TPA: 4-hydroxythreonine-4-phosphate dehydrogenase PdxA [Candidatus Limnocylindrales bacterium]|nr:4-hydroxythreonine-4-phosphate dehydrogenase PdxA [Candidatus Limnocylindrales bacterium]